MIQQGWTSRAGFELGAKMAPITPQPPSPRNAGMFVLGFDTMELPQIGQNIVGMMGQ